jgi:TolB-like protein/class 3 adenylate cyclase/Flp pilus assembly protein TadD
MSRAPLAGAGSPVAAQEVKRKLAAILKADVAGYSRLIGEDAGFTVRTLTAYRAKMGELVARHGGLLVGTPGDSFLAEFASVAEMVDCAVSIQDTLKTLNEKIPLDRRIQFRIGLNLGDIIHEGDDIHGDGVNIAARLEALAPPGGICVSRVVYEQVRSRPFAFEDLGEHRVKNIAEPVRVYRLDPAAAPSVKKASAALPRLDRQAKRGFLYAVFGSLVVIAAGVAGFAGWHAWMMGGRAAPAHLAAAPAAPAAVGRALQTALALPDRPSIAVLPFENIGREPEQDHLAEGVADTIITALSHVSNLFVIARSSTFAYKGKSVKVQQVGQDLGVRYVLQGSVQKSGERVRVAAHLVDAISGKQLWAERYDRTLKDVFALQDEITRNVLVALEVKLTEGEQARVWHRGTDNLEAHLLVIQSRDHYVRHTKEDNLRSRELAEKAIALDPKFAWAHVRLAWTHWQDARLGWSSSRVDSLNRAIERAKAAFDLDDRLPDTYALLGALHVLLGRHEDAMAFAEKAVALGPNHAYNTGIFAWILLYSGRPEAAIPVIEKAIRLSPYNPAWNSYWLAEAYRLTGRYEELIPVAKETIERSAPSQLDSHMQLVYAYWRLGREKEARAHVEAMLKLVPNFSVAAAKPIWSVAWPFKDSREIDRYFEVLRQAGVPE